MKNNQNQPHDIGLKYFLPKALFMALEYHESEEIPHIKNFLAFLSINILPLERYKIICLLAIIIKVKIMFLIQK